jgi:hypothetical protein
MVKNIFLGGMMNVFIKKVRYVNEVPEELTEKAIEAGELKKGSVVGLDVKFWEYGVEGLIELKLTKDGQEKLVKEGKITPVEDAGSIYYLREDWVNFLEDVAQKPEPLPERQESNKLEAKQEVIAIESEAVGEPVKTHFPSHN